MGLILPLRPNKLAFPATRPGFNPTHPAANGTVLVAAVCGNNGDFYDIRNGRPGTVTNSAGSIVPKIDSILGPSIAYPSSGSNSIVQFPMTGANKTNYTLAAIFRCSPPASSYSYILGTYDGNTGAGVGFALNAAGVINTNQGLFNFNDIGGSPVFDFGASPTFIGHPVFHVQSVSNTDCHWVFADLLTGQIYSGVMTISASSGTDAHTQLGIGNRPQTVDRPCVFPIAAATIIENTSRRLSLTELLAWAGDPWSFWYPQKFDLSFLLRVPPVAAPTGTLAATETPDTAAFNGTVAVAGTLATTEAADIAVFNGNTVVSGTLAVTEAPDTAAFNGNTVASGSFAVTEAQDVASFAGSGIVSGTLATTDTPDIAVLSGNAGTSGSLSATTSQDVAAFAGNFGIAGSWVSTEASDLAVFVGQFGIASGTLAANDNADIAAFIGSATGAPTGSLAVTELPDNVVFLIDYMAPPSVTAASPYPSPFDYGWSYGEPPLRPGMPGSGTGRSS